MSSTQNPRINSCQHVRLRAALQYPGIPARGVVEARTGKPGVRVSQSLFRHTAGLVMLGVVYFFFASFVAVDYSEWETPTDKGEIAICQTTEDGQTRIVTLDPPKPHS